MKDPTNRAAVRLAPQRQQFVLDRIVEKLGECQIAVLIAVLDDHHLHLLARFPDHRPRHWVGLAKKHSSHSVNRLDGAVTGGLWAAPGKAEPAVDREHQMNVVGYLLDHWARGAALHVVPELRPKLNSMLSSFRARKERRRGRRAR